MEPTRIRSSPSPVLPAEVFQEFLRFLSLAGELDLHGRAREIRPVRLVKPLPFRKGTGAVRIDAGPGLDDAGDPEPQLFVNVFEKAVGARPQVYRGGRGACRDRYVRG